MEETAIGKYLEKDYADALSFYDRSANNSKRCYQKLSVLVIVVSAVLTPFVAFAPEGIVWRIVAATLSATIVVSTGLLSHLKCHDNWLSYRNSWDALKRERRLFEMSAGPYQSSENKAALFVNRVEGILTAEGAAFYARHAKGEEQAKKSGDAHDG